MTEGARRGGRELKGRFCLSVYVVGLGVYGSGTTALPAVYVRIRMIATRAARRTRQREREREDELLCTRPVGQSNASA